MVNHEVIKIKDEKKSDFISLRAQGFSFDKISKMLEVSKPTLLKWSKEFEVEIGNLKKMELEMLYETYYMQKQNRIKWFGKFLTKINEELETRDLSKMPTDKLFDLMIKSSKYLKEERPEMIFKEKRKCKYSDITYIDEWKAE